MEKEEFARELFNRYGTVKRARGCFLYTAKNVRLTDLYQEEGRAILGWGGSSAFTMFKNFLNRGANGSFITDCSYRLEKAVSALLNSKRSLVFFSNREKCLEAAKNFGGEENSFYAPWLLDKNGNSIKWSEKKYVALQFPLAWAQEIYVLAVKCDDEKACADSVLEETKKIKVDYKAFLVEIPSPLKAAYARSVYNLLAAIQERSEKDWFLWDTVLNPYFVRKGPYLYTKLSESNYDDFVLYCLNLGILINPDFNGISIVPFGADRGVLNCLKKNPFKIS